MGNNSSREQRRQSQSPTDRPTTSSGGPTSPTDRLNTPIYSSRGERGSRSNLSFLGLGSNSNVEVVEVRRESKQEREARKLEKDRVNRLKEREKSMKEEHVDGGYLVTQGVYTGIEDFNKAIVRQFMIERRIAPFWRGLEDHKSDWTEHQLVAAARGLPIPAADEIPAEDPAKTTSSEASTNANFQNLMVPINGRSHSYASDLSANLSASHPAFSPVTSTPPTNSASLPQISSSPFRPRSKTLASLTTSSRNPSQSDIVPREIQLPHDPYVNGQAIEAFLYKDADDCPICFLSYPPYLNKTRCCDQAICSECFVQIKRPDPHPPEHADPSNPTPNAEQADPETLVSEPSTCPYCQQPEFGVTYEPPPFRRGLSYANMPNLSSAMSSSSSISSEGVPFSPTQRRRTISISANNTSVITTDKIRPDWATKLNNARNHVARRSAAATALHTAAYLMGNNGGSEGRGFRSRFGRSRGGDSYTGQVTPPGTSDERTNNLNAFAALAERHAILNRGNTGPSSISSRRRSRLDDLEEMMMNEAIRLSLAAEEERSKKEEKEKKKIEKKKEKERGKEAKKAEKAARKSMYGGGSSGSTLSLSLPGRRRGNSTNSSLFDNAEKGKSVDRGNIMGIGSSSVQNPSTNKAAPTTLTSVNVPLSQGGDAATVHTPTMPSQSSHLRYMSNASSPASSYVESADGSHSLNDSPNASGANVDGHDHGNTEPMFNFRKLAETIGEEDADDKEEASKHVEYLGGESSQEFGTPSLSANAAGEAATEEGNLTQSVSTVRPDDYEERSTPEVTVTPVSPSIESGNDASKQLGQGIYEAIGAQEIV